MGITSKIPASQAGQKKPTTGGKACYVTPISATKQKRAADDDDGNDEEEVVPVSVTYSASCVEWRAAFTISLIVVGKTLQEQWGSSSKSHSIQAFSLTKTCFSRLNPKGNRYVY
jgi:hypothetical protein